ncbi:MAG: OmpA family protein [Marinilabiliales bacterium]
MNIKLPVVLLIFTFLFDAGVCQNVRKLVKYGDEQFATGNYFTALDFYERALETNKIPAIAYKCAEAARLSYDFEKAEKWYSYVVKKDEAKYPLSRFWLGDTYKSMGEYQKAVYQFNYFLKNVKKNNIKVDDYYMQKVKHELIACEKAFYYKLEPVGVIINHLDTNINSVYSEFGITKIYDSLLIFGSYRKDELDTSRFIAKLYKSKIDSTKTGQAELLDTLINKPGFHITNPCFSDKHNALYFCMIPLDGSSGSRIYRSIYSHGKFNEPELLPDKINMDGTNSLHPNIAIVGDKEYLVFASDRSDGIGGFDLWFSGINSDGSFNDVFNVGCNLNKYDKSEWYYLKKESSINSIDDEVTPFYNSVDSTLYFSSKWHYSLGGFDIFKVKGDFKEWGEVENLGYPINTNSNELYFMIDPKAGQAFYSSNRTGSFSLKNDNCCNDIYSFDIPKYIDKEEIEKRKLQVFEEEIKLLVPLTLYFHNDIPNPNSLDTTTELTYEQTYQEYINMIDEYKHEYSKGFKKNEKDDAEERIVDFFENEVKKGYEELEKFCMLMEKLLEKGETVEITIKGYASPLHKSDYNVNLSKRRIQSLVNYLMSYKDGVFAKYTNEDTTGGKQLIIRREAYGEETANTTVSDDVKDLVHSVYSPEAAYERKIKIIAISMKRKEKQE